MSYIDMVEVAEPRQLIRNAGFVKVSAPGHMMQWLKIAPNGNRYWTQL